MFIHFYVRVCVTTSPISKSIYCFHSSSGRSSTDCEMASSKIALDLSTSPKDDSSSVMSTRQKKIKGRQNICILNVGSILVQSSSTTSNLKTDTMSGSWPDPTLGTFHRAFDSDPYFRAGVLVQCMT